MLLIDIVFATRMKTQTTKPTVENEMKVQVIVSSKIQMTKGIHVNIPLILFILFGKYCRQTTR